MHRKPRRIVAAAIIDDYGPVTAEDLLAMDDDGWGIIRDRITDRRHTEDGLVASCMACGSRLYIRVASGRGAKTRARPLFAHYAGGDPNCPWYDGSNINPNGARAAQYNGQQESEFHRRMCEQVGQLVSLDRRYIRHTVEKYLAPTENVHGRFPDIYVEWANFGPFAIEFQMSDTFQTELSARCKHYEREGIPLLWILFGLQPATIPSQSFTDVIRRHRGNAFLLDRSAVAESKSQQTLVLSCYLKSANGFDAPKLVRFDELTIPSSKVPFYQDRIVGKRLSEAAERRRPWFKALATWDRDSPFSELTRKECLLVASAFSIVAAATGKQRNYATKHPNVLAMLNTLLNSGTLSKYTNLLTCLIANTSMSNLLDNTVGDHLRRCRHDIQDGEQSKVWQLLRHLLPEALDPVLRAELAYLDALPNWAVSKGHQRKV